MSLYKQLKYSSEQLKKLAKEREAIWPPPISFSLMGKFTLPATGSSEKDNKDSTKYVKFDVLLVNTDPASAKYERKVKIFEDGTPFEWCDFREHTGDLFEAFGCTTAAAVHATQRHHFYIALFAGRARVQYISCYNLFNSRNLALELANRESDSNVLIRVINEVAKAFFDSWDSAVQEQQQYMRQNLFLGDTKPSTFIERLKRMNRFLKYFPKAVVLPETDNTIDEVQLITIVHHASHGIMQLQIQRAGKSINDFRTLDSLKVFFTQQHDCDRLEERLMKTGEKSGKDESGKSKKKNRNSLP